MCELDYEEGWAPKNWCFWTVVLERLLRVPWTARRSNQSILKEISPGISLEGMMLKLKLKIFSNKFHSKQSCCCCCSVASVVSDPVWPHRWQPTRLPHPWDSLGKNTGVGCHFLLQCMKVKSESEVAQSCPTPSNPTDCSPPGSSAHGILQARVLE